MDLRAYIASGILEMYVLGQTSEKESKEVENYARKYPEIATELNAVQIAFLKYNQINAMPVKNYLMSRILKKVNLFFGKKIKLNGHDKFGNN